MKDINKYRGIIPAFYACYAPDGSISTEGVKALTRHLIAKGVKGVYVGGSSGECIYQHPDERKAVLEAVMSEAKGKITVIAHVACNNTADSVELAAHAEKCGVDAIASIPPIYFHLPNYAIADYWNAMSAAAPNTEFIIYNIPQLAGTALTMPLLNEMLKNPNVIAVKNSSMPTQDIQMFKDAGIQARGADGFAVFNGPDEQFVSGRVMARTAASAAPTRHAGAVHPHERADRTGRHPRRPRHPVQGRPHHLQNVRSQGQPVRRHEGDPAPDVRAGSGRCARPAGEPCAGGRGHRRRGAAHD